MRKTDQTRTDRSLHKSPDSSPEYFSMLYDDLRSIARIQASRMKPGETLRATALINEVYLKLYKRQWHDEAEFLCVAAAAMRNLLIDAARSKVRLKRGGDVMRFTLGGFDPEDPRMHTPDEILIVEEFLQDLEELDSELAHMVLLRFFGGLPLSQLSEIMNIPLRTLERRWAFVRNLFNQQSSGGH